MIHPTAIVQTEHVGPNTRIWQFVVILKDVRIGDDCNINGFVGIDDDVVIGDHVTIKSGTFIGSGVRVQDHVFIGPYVCFVNDRHPRSRVPATERPIITLEEGCTIGAQVIIMEGIRVGRYALVGAGCTLTRDVEPFALMAGRPARRVGWVDRAGRPLERDGDRWMDEEGGHYSVVDGALRKLEP
ncbi:MAG: N-acetyltransferase [Flavobacteriales bacterium]|nr:N-acetyltransferase [Flavobacteriales bacterium]MCB0770306.1 N-acetyltransferase [Flavobacteriales bacterium]